MIAVYDLHDDYTAPPVRAWVYDLTDTYSVPRTIVRRVDGEWVALTRHRRYDGEWVTV